MKESLETKPFSSKLVFLFFFTIGFVCVFFIFNLPIEYLQFGYSRYAPRSPAESRFPPAIRSFDYKYCYEKNSSTIIFLQLTDETDEWKFLEICAIKSAALANPDSGVCVLTKIPMKPDPILDTLPNLEIVPLDIDVLLGNSSLADWYETYSRENSQYVVWQISDGLRFVYLYKYGGRYLDTDVLTLRNFSRSDLENVLGYESDQYLNGAVLFFEPDHPFIKAMLDNFLKNFRPNVWGSVGPSLITSVHKSGRVNSSTYRVLEQRWFYPTRYTQHEWPFTVDNSEKMRELVNGSYTLHLWRYLEKGYWKLDAKTPNGSFVQEICGD